MKGDKTKTTADLHKPSELDNAHGKTTEVIFVEEKRAEASEIGDDSG